MTIDGKMGREKNRPEWLPLLDLRAVTRDAERTVTRISVELRGVPYLWLLSGSLSRFEMGSKSQWLGVLHRSGIRDREGDSSYAFRFGVIGAAVDDVSYGWVRFSAWISPALDSDDAFCVPIREWSVSDFPKQKDGDRLAPYTPPVDRNLWEKLRGARISVEVGPASEES